MAIDLPKWNFDFKHGTQTEYQLGASSLSLIFMALVTVFQWHTVW